MIRVLAIAAACALMAVPAQATPKRFLLNELRHGGFQPQSTREWRCTYDTSMTCDVYFYDRGNGQVYCGLAHVIRREAWWHLTTLGCAYW